MTRPATRKRRTWKRGAALVESAVVLPVLAIFLGLILFKYTSYREKMAAQQTARKNAMHFASHSCEGSDEGVRSERADAPIGNDNGGNGNNGQGTIDKGPPGGDAMEDKTDRDSNMAVSEQTVTAKAGGRERQVTGKSYVYCNEKPEDGNAAAVIQWSFSMFNTGVL